MIISIIKGTGHYLPKKVIKNKYFLNFKFYNKGGLKINKSNKEIINKFKNITEIEERRYVEKNILNSDIAAIAAKGALTNSNINKEELDYIISAHNYGDINHNSFQSDLVPSIAAKVKNKLQIKNNKCRPYDMIFGCPGWIEGMILADKLLKSKYAKNILITGSETLSKVIDPHDKNSMIFSDGAGAAILSSISIKNLNEKFGVIGYDSQCDNNNELNYLSNGPSINLNYKKSLVNIKMNGRKIYEYAITEMPKMLKKIIDNNNFHLKDIKKILIHQANAKMDYAILNRLLKLYNYDLDNNFCKKIMPMTIQKFGNSSVATVPTILDLILKKKMLPHKINPGDVILMASLGAGMNINGIIYRFQK
ncbi:3-oxoacyl-ACP synthase III family protein [Blattabacterium cuenoti]|uniref:3-oxoacyl-ACP synthase III family protein n=1 Tax=Blattabacterium cuenoti TaxID=1653831 RepID=UPI00163C59C4|nr:3-oxoacyl-ACP synthase III family protein [Blattabacterium cuenoti]